jgi:YVTN family beta-propeller protein
LRAALWFGPISAVCLWLGAAALWPSTGAGKSEKVLAAAAPARIATPSAKAAPVPAIRAAAAIPTVPGMPPVLDPENLYSATRAGALSPAVAGALSRIYVPNLRSNDVWVIDPQRLAVVDRFKVGVLPQHVVPSWDLKTLWVTNNGRGGNDGSLTPIDPTTGKPGPAIAAPDPYNMYFTPDGSSAIVVAERLKRLDFRDPHTMQLQQSVPTPKCPGIDHGDFSIDGRYAIFTCEFGGDLVKIDIAGRRVAGYLSLARGASPQDIRISPDGRIFYIADMVKNGVFLVDGDAFAKIGFVATGVGTHALYPSRDATRLYVENRGTHINAGRPRGPGSIAVIDFRTRAVVQTWPIPGGGSPDMGNVSADGGHLWVAGRWDDVVYRIDTQSGAVNEIPVGREPHGLCVWPQPGRYSTGHTGNMR